MSASISGGVFLYPECVVCHQPATHIVRLPHSTTQCTRRHFSEGTFLFKETWMLINVSKCWAETSHNPPNRQLSHLSNPTPAWISGDTRNAPDWSGPRVSEGGDKLGLPAECDGLDLFFVSLCHVKRAPHSWQLSCFCVKLPCYSSLHDREALDILDGCLRDCSMWWNLSCHESLVLKPLPVLFLSPCSSPGWWCQTKATRP